MHGDGDRAGHERTGTGSAWRQVTSELADERTWEPAVVGDSRKGCVECSAAQHMRAAPPADGCLRVQRCLRARGACAAAREGSIGPVRLNYYCYEFIRSKPGSVAAGWLSVEPRPRPTVLVPWCPPAPASARFRRACCLPLVSCVHACATRYECAMAGSGRGHAQCPARSATTTRPSPCRSPAPRADSGSSDPGQTPAETDTCRPPRDPKTREQRGVVYARHSQSQSRQHE